VIRRATIVGAMLWTLAVTCLRAARLPNDFSKEHWFIDYRFGFVKRGLIGTLVSVAAAAGHARPSERLIDILSVGLFLLFCAALVWLCLRIVRLSGWTSGPALALLVFLSSPFVVMSAHLIGYYDNIIIVLTIVSLALLFGNWIRAAAIVQAIAILVHENALLIGFPPFLVAWRLQRTGRPSSGRLPLAPMLPVAAFTAIVLAQAAAPPSLERSLTGYLSTYPFLAATIGAVRVPHWITITFHDSYVLHQGHFRERILSQQLLTLVLPTVLAILGSVFDAFPIGAVSVDSLLILGTCLVPETMHVMAWDTARIWTYTIVDALFVWWAYAELRTARESGSQWMEFVCLIVLLVNAIVATPLMDGLRDQFDVTTRLLLYIPALAAASSIAISSPSAARARDYPRSDDSGPPTGNTTSPTQT
jgi:hypothetical protein